MKPQIIAIAALTFFPGLNFAGALAEEPSAFSNPRHEVLVDSPDVSLDPVASTPSGTEHDMIITKAGDTLDCLVTDVGLRRVHYKHAETKERISIERSQVDKVVYGTATNEALDHEARTGMTIFAALLTATGVATAVLIGILVSGFSEFSWE